MPGMILCAYLAPEKVAVILKNYPLAAYTVQSITDEEKFRKYTKVKVLLLFLSTDWNFNALFITH
jgi:hypothetical protein